MADPQVKAIVEKLFNLKLVDTENIESSRPLQQGFKKVVHGMNQVTDVIHEKLSEVKQVVSGVEQAVDGAFLLAQGFNGIMGGDEPLIEGVSKSVTGILKIVQGCKSAMASIPATSALKSNVNSVREGLASALAGAYLIKDNVGKVFSEFYTKYVHRDKTPLRSIVSLKPQLVVQSQDFDEALEYYENVFGAEVLETHHLPKQELAGVELKIGSFVFVLSASRVERGFALSLKTEDVSGLITKAHDAVALYGGEVTQAGGRWILTDPYGSIWYINRGSSSVTPQLRLTDSKVDEEIEFFKSAFGAVVLKRELGPKRKADQELPSVVSAELRLGSLVFVVSDETTTLATKSTFRLETTDVAGVCEVAMKSGAKVKVDNCDADGRRVGAAPTASTRGHGMMIFNDEQKNDLIICHPDDWFRYN